MKAARHHTDDDIGMTKGDLAAEIVAVERQGFAKRLRIAAEVPLPRAIAQNDQPIAPWLVVSPGQTSVQAPFDSSIENVAIETERQFLTLRVGAALHGDDRHPRVVTCDSIFDPAASSATSRANTPVRSALSFAVSTAETFS